MRGIPPVGFRTEAERALAMLLSSGKINGSFAVALRAALGLLESLLPPPAALASFDPDTRQALLSLVEGFGAQGAVSAAFLDSVMTALAPPMKAGKRFRQWVAAHKGMESDALREALTVELVNAVALGGKHSKYYCRLHSLRLLLDGLPVDWTGYGLKALAAFKQIADAAVFRGGLPHDVLEKISEAERKRSGLLQYLKEAKIPKPKLKTKSLRAVDEEELREYLATRAPLPSKTATLSKAQRRELKRFLKNRKTTQTKG
jgi:hypothetical protein